RWPASGCKSPPMKRTGRSASPTLIAHTRALPQGDRGFRPAPRRRAADERDELAPFIKKMHPKLLVESIRWISSSRVGRRPVGNSFDHFVRASEHHGRNLEAERLGCLEVDDQFEKQLDKASVFSANARTKLLQY